MLKDITVSAPVEDEDGWSTRELVYSPMKVDCPEFIRAIVGDTMFVVTDIQRWNDNIRPCHLSFQIRPSFLTSLSQTNGELLLEAFPVTDKEAPQDERRDSTLSSDDDDAAIAKSHYNNANNNASNKHLPEESDKSHMPEETGSEIESAGPDTETENETIDSSDDDETTDASTTTGLGRLPPEDKSIFRVMGQTKVRILTLGWFVERAIVHNMRLFYRDYPTAVYAFRQKLYRDFADNDQSVPISEVVDRLLQSEAEQTEVDGSLEQDLRDGCDVDCADACEDGESAERLPSCETMHRDLDDAEDNSHARLVQTVGGLTSRE